MAITPEQIAAASPAHAAFLRGVLRVVALEPVENYADPAVYEAALELAEWFQDRMAMVTEELAARLVDRLEYFQPSVAVDLVQISVAELAASGQLPLGAMGVRWPLHDECAHHAIEALPRTQTLFEPGIRGVVLFPGDVEHLDCIDCSRLARVSGAIS